MNKCCTYPTEDKMHICNAIVHMHCGDGCNTDGGNGGGTAEKKDCLFEGTHTYHFHQDLVGGTGTNGGGSKWEVGPEMPLGLAGFGCTVVGDKVYVIGGDSNRTMQSSCRVLDTATGEWSSIADLPVPLYMHGCDAVDGIIYAVGGRANTPGVISSNLYAYDIASNVWDTSLPLMPGKATDGNSACVAYGKKLYCFSNEPSSSPPNTCSYDLYVFDTVSRTWETKDSFVADSTVYFTNIARVGSKIFGFHWNNSLVDLTIYDIFTDTWSVRKTNTPNITTKQLASIGNKILLFTVKKEGSSASSDEFLHIYNTEDGSWEREYIGQQEMSAQCVSVGNKVYMLGGVRFGENPSSTTVPTVNIYTPNPTVLPEPKPLLTLPKGATVWATKPCHADGIALGLASDPTTMPKRAEFSTMDLRTSGHEELSIVVTQPAQ